MHIRSHRSTSISACFIFDLLMSVIGLLCYCRAAGELMRSIKRESANSSINIILQLKRNLLVDGVGSRALNWSQEHPHSTPEVNKFNALATNALTLFFFKTKHNFYRNTHEKLQMKLLVVTYVVSMEDSEEFWVGDELHGWRLEQQRHVLIIDRRWRTFPSLIYKHYRIGKVQRKI